MGAIIVTKVEPRLSESATFALTARPMKALRCVFCHDKVRMEGLAVSNCPSCQTCYHKECRELFYGKTTCPTFGCEAILEESSHRLPRRKPEFIERPIFDWNLRRALTCGLNILLAMVVTVFFTTFLLALGLWFLTFKFPPMNLVGILVVLGGFLQAPALFILCSQKLTARTQHRRN